MIDESRIIKKYPYRQKLILVAVYSILFFAIVTVLPTTTAWVVGLIILGCFSIFQLVEAIQSWQDPFRKKIAFTENSIIGPSWNDWWGETPYNEIEIFYSEIKTVNLIVGKQLSIEITTPSKTMNLQYGRLDELDFKDIYDCLAKNLNKPSFDESAPSFLIKRYKRLQK